MEIKDVDSRDFKKIVNLEQKIFKENAFSKDLIERLIQENFFFLKLEINKFKKQIIGFIIVLKDQKDRV
ncbi:MAG: hypothetical protein ACFFDX_16065, partial [Candidatus Odinarchaeota archaeon]